LSDSNCIIIGTVITGSIPHMAGFDFRFLLGALRLVIIALAIIVSAVSTWIVGIKARRRIQRDLGRKATETDLTSLDTWMEAEEVEREKDDKPTSR
jgi:hypothetical protein